MEPINYTTDVQTPFQAALQGYQAGTAIRDDQFKQQQIQAAQAQQQRQAQMLQSLISNPNATAKDYANASLAMPGLKDNFKQAFEMRNTEQQQSTLRDLGQYYAAVTSGRPDIAVEQMKKRADAMETAGVPKQEVQALRAQAQVIEAHPEFARATMGMLLSSVPGGDKFLTAAAAAGTEQRAAEQAPADLAKKRAEAGIKVVEAGVAPRKSELELQKAETDIQNTLSQIGERGARLGLDRDKLTSETQTRLMELNKQFGELPSDARKNLNDSAAQATASEQGATQLLDLAKRLEASNASSGGFATVAEGWKRIYGSQDEITALRQEYTRIRSQGVTKMLPPGPASDKDIEIAMSGFPSEKSNPAQLSAFLRGMAKLQTYDAVLNNAKAEWFGQVQHLGSTKKDIVIDGVKVPAGSTFNDFATKFVTKKAAQVTGANLVNSLAEKYGAPAAAPSTGGATGSF
jgi:hypothetical protein